MITSEICRNEKVASLPDAGRFLFIGIFSNADDDGRLKASPKFLKATIFPYDEDKTADQVRQLRDQCAALGLIRLYSKNGTDYLDLPGWYEHQVIRKDRYRPSKMPSYDEADSFWQPNGNRAATIGCRSIGEGRGGKVSLVNRIPTGSVLQQKDTSKKTRLKPHQQEAGQFLDMVVEHEQVRLLNRGKLIHQVRTKLFEDPQSTPQKLFEFYRWLKENDPFFSNKAPPQIIGGMPDRYPSWLAGKLKGGEGDAKQRKGVRARPKQERRRPITRIPGHEEAPG
jgi:hypothetical protein